MLRYFAIPSATAYVVPPAAMEQIKKIKTDPRVAKRIKRDAQIFKETSLGGCEMRGFMPSDFSDYNTYETHHRALERAQGASDQLFKIWDDLTGFTRRNPCMYFELKRLLHDVTQVGYEAGIGKLHRSTDYDITPETLSNKIKCQFCTHQYLVYGCEPECNRLKAGLPCEIEVREFLE